MWYKYQSQEADTHLLHRMVHHRTNLRGGGHSIQMIIRSKKATVIHQSTTQTGSNSGSEFRANERILQRANTTGSVRCGRNLLLDVFNNEVRVFLWSNKIEMSTKVFNKSNPFLWRRYKNTCIRVNQGIGWGFILRKVNFHTYARAV